VRAQGGIRIECELLKPRRRKEARGHELGVLGWEIKKQCKVEGNGVLNPGKRRRARARAMPNAAVAVS
jgi:hypothetical protein